MCKHECYWLWCDYTLTHGKDRVYMFPLGRVHD